MAEDEKLTKKEAEKKEVKTLIEEANAAAERIEKANEEYAKLLRQQEELMVQDKLGGKSEGRKPEEPKQVISPREYAENALKGQI